MKDRAEYEDFFAIDADARHGAKPEERAGTTDGAALIAKERARHHSIGWTCHHDLGHPAGALAMAASAYARCAGELAAGEDPPLGHPPVTWPWSAEYWKPSKDPVETLVKAGALIAAEIDRIALSKRAAREVAAQPPFDLLLIL